MLQKIPLKLFQQKFRAWKRHLVHLPIQIRFSIPSEQLMIVCRVILLIWSNPLRCLLKHVESRVQPPKSQQLLVRSRINLERIRRGRGRGFDKHNRSEAHQWLYIIQQQCEGIGEQVSQTHAEEKSVIWQALLEILSNILFLARQALPLRGDGDGIYSNFTQLYILREEGNPILKQ